MQPREKLLAGAAGFLVLVAGGYLGWGYVDEMFLFREQQILATEKQILQQKQVILEGRKAQRKLAFWNEQSLPTDVQLASTLYQQWLGDSVKNAGLKDYKINPGQIIQQRAPNSEEVLFHKLPFNFRVQGDLEELTDFLFTFYSAPHLHQVRRLSIQPLERGLDLQMSVESLVLSSGYHESSLSQARLKRLSRDEIAEYRQAIVQRNLFAEYEPPRPPPPPPPPPRKVETRPPPPPPKPSFDPAKYAVISAIIEVGGEPQVWINDRTAGKILKFREGDSLSIGQLDAKISRIGTLDLVLEHSEGQRLLTLGETLHEGVDLPPE